MPRLGEGGISPRREAVDVFRRRVAGEEERLAVLIELEHLRSGLGDGRGEEMVRCRSACGDLIEGEEGGGALEVSFIERRLSECERAAACAFLLVLTLLVFLLPETADWLCLADIVFFTGTNPSQLTLFAMKDLNVHSRLAHIDICDL